MNVSSSGGTLKLAHLRIILLQRLEDPSAREDVVNLDVSNFQFSIDIRESHGSGKGYDLQRSEVTSPLRGSCGSVFSKGVTLPQSTPYVP